MSTATSLPPAFADLLPYLEWAQPTTTERLRYRATRPMAELTAFYEALKPRMEDVMVFLKDFPPDEAALDPPVQALMRLAKSFMDAAFAVEIVKAPDEPGVWTFETMDLSVTFYRDQAAASA